MGKANPKTRFFPPTVLESPKMDSKVMSEEVGSHFLLILDFRSHIANFPFRVNRNPLTVHKQQAKAISPISLLPSIFPDG